ncbi:MAG: response regulator [Chromatiales bacterium]|nr:response regulator [Chromatiales bacterium]
MTRILIVDDDPHIREVLRFALAKEGFAVSEAENGAQALERFEQAPPDLVVLDILMPEMNGTEVCRRLRLQHATPDRGS